jgi:glycine cleavage system H protein
MEVVTMAVEKGLRYTKDHEWVRIEDDTATVGITDYAQQQLGELVFVELPRVGKAVDAHKTLAVVESSKSASDVFAPVTGQVTQVNSELESKPELINQDCYQAGWICKLKMADKKPPKDLMNAQQYEEYLKTL